ncbi:MAG: ArsR/SmtB family transcription factor, partial [Halioglobus sp.]
MKTCAAGSKAELGDKTQLDRSCRPLPLPIQITPGQVFIKVFIALLCYSMYSWNMKQSNAIKILSAVAHDGRLTLIRHLIQAGPEGVSAGDLARFAKIGPTTASAQLLVLANAGLVRSERSGRQV